jgi:hypothetical protein
MAMSARLAGLSALLVLSAASASAGGAAQEVATAAIHAGLAASADSAKMVQSHLQHTINCLQGPTGADFNPGPGNPCKDLGAGAIPDSAPDQRASLAAVAEQAKKAMAESDMAKAKAMASDIQASLKK